MKKCRIFKRNKERIYVSLSVYRVKEFIVINSYFLVY